MTMIRISDDHVKDFKALVSETLILISGMSTGGNGEPMIYYIIVSIILGNFLLLTQFLILCTISPFENTKFSTLLSGTATH